MSNAKTPPDRAKQAPRKRDGGSVREEPSPPRWVLPAVMITVLVIGGWFIIQNLADTSKLEDCQMAGRHNCVPPIDTSTMH